MKKQYLILIISSLLALIISFIVGYLISQNTVHKISTKKEDYYDNTDVKFYDYKSYSLNDIKASSYNNFFVFSINDNSLKEKDFKEITDYLDLMQISYIILKDETNELTKEFVYENTFYDKEKEAVLIENFSKLKDLDLTPLTDLSNEMDKLLVRYEGENLAEKLAKFEEKDLETFYMLLADYNNEFSNLFNQELSSIYNNENALEMDIVKEVDFDYIQSKKKPLFYGETFNVFHFYANNLRNYYSDLDTKEYILSSVQQDFPIQ